jgi:transketolase
MFKLFEFMTENTPLIILPKLLANLSLISTTNAGSGHPTSCLSAVQIVAGLVLSKVYRASFDDSGKAILGSDQLIFSKGHAAPLLYALHVALGNITEDYLINNLRKYDSNLEGHTTYRFAGSDASTGSLGQGIAIGLGYQYAARQRGSSERTFVLVGDSELAEGSNWEALMSSTAFPNLVVLADLNGLGQTGHPLLGTDVKKYQRLFEASGLETIIVQNGNAINDCVVALNKINDQRSKPLAILFCTKKGAGVSFLESKDGKHGKALTKDELELALDEIGRVSFTNKYIIDKPTKIYELLQEDFVKNNTSVEHNLSPREAYSFSLLEYSKNNSSIIVLDAETSNSTRSELVKKSIPDQFIESYIAEGTMLGIATGLAHAGYTPITHTFAAFYTRAADQLRMTTANNSKIICVGSHNGVAIGEDGSSQMGLEEITMFAHLPGSVILCGSDSVSASKMLDIGLDNQHVSYIINGRNAVPTIYRDTDIFGLGGSKTLFSSQKDVLTVLSYGQTLHECIGAIKLLPSDLLIRLVDCYSLKPLDTQTVKDAVNLTKKVLIVEDCFAPGGLAPLVHQALEGIEYISYWQGIDSLPHSGTPAQNLASFGLDAASIAEKILHIIKS